MANAISASYRTSLKTLVNAGITKERIDRLKSIFVMYVVFWRSYPDLFLDVLKPSDSAFDFFFYQRIFLRIIFRYNYVFATFTRAFSKSFLSILSLYIKCILYPGVKLFVCAEGKEQAAQIAKDKIYEFWEIWPALKHEVNFGQGVGTTFSKDSVTLVFKNGSRLGIVQVRDSARGGRKNGGLIEEAVLIDGQKLNEVIIPMMNVNRQAKCGGYDPNELHKHQIYVIYSYLCNPTKITIVHHYMETYRSKTL